MIETTCMMIVLGFMWAAVMLTLYVGTGGVI